MNVFCHPFARRSAPLAQLLGLERITELDFGYSPQVPLGDGKGDETEVDLFLGDSLAEAKLTEADFTKKKKSNVERYRDFRTVFDPALLPQNDKEYVGYQLIRNILGAHALRKGFVLLLDSRRPDLLRAFWQVASAIKPAELRARCRFVLWQEIAAIAPRNVWEFLKEKYGIRR